MAHVEGVGTERGCLGSPQESLYQGILPQPPALIHVMGLTGKAGPQALSVAAALFCPEGKPPHRRLEAFTMADGS